jgi:hypothetical protein
MKGTEIAIASQEKLPSERRSREVRQGRNTPTNGSSVGEMWFDTFLTYKNPQLLAYLRGDEDFSNLPSIDSYADLRDGYGSRGSRIKYKHGLVPSQFIGELPDGSEVAVFLAEGQAASGGTIDLTNQLVVVHSGDEVLYRPGQRKPMKFLTVIAPRYADAAAEVARRRSR